MNQSGDDLDDSLGFDSPRLLMGPYLWHPRVSIESYHTNIMEGGSIRVPTEADIWIHSGFHYFHACSLHVSFRWYLAVRELALLALCITNAHHEQLSWFVLTICGKCD